MNQSCNLFLLNWDVALRKDFLFYSVKFCQKHDCDSNFLWNRLPHLMAVIDRIVYLKLRFHLCIQSNSVLRQREGTQYQCCPLRHRIITSCAVRSATGKNLNPIYEWPWSTWQTSILFVIIADRLPNIRGMHAKWNFSNCNQCFYRYPS